MKVVKNGGESDNQGFAITMYFLEENNIGGSGDFAEELDFD